MTAVCRKTNIQ